MTRRSYGWVFAVLGLAAAAGCGSTVVDETAGTTGGMTSGGGGSEECPMLLPKSGASCSSEGKKCTYPLHCDSEDTATCKGDKWVVAMGGCSCEGPCCPDSCPPMFTCPTDVPTVGDSCQAEGSDGNVCSYTVKTPCGPEQVMFVCPAGTWEQSGPSGCFSGVSCHQRSENDCASDGKCEWYEPGCVAGGGTTAILPEAGCFPVGDCSATPDLCSSTQEQCTPFVINPCFDKGCDLCGATASLCALDN